MDKKIGIEVRNPNLYPDPSRISNPQLYKYQSLDEKKMQQSYRNYMKSYKYIGGILLGCLILKPFVDQSVQYYIFGENGNGGRFMKMYSTITPHDYSYNREYQRMCYLSEVPQGDDPLQNVTDQQLIDLGVKVVPQGNNFQIYKKSAHFKYF